jgi:hypothetical protein
LIDPFISATRPNNDFVDAAEAFGGEATVKNKARGPTAVKAWMAGTSPATGLWVAGRAGWRQAQ